MSGIYTKKKNGTTFRASTSGSVNLQIIDYRLKRNFDVKIIMFKIFAFFH